jgi:hypothetical protein
LLASHANVSALGGRGFYAESVLFFASFVLSSLRLCAQGRKEDKQFNDANTNH